MRDCGSTREFSGGRCLTESGSRLVEVWFAVVLLPSPTATGR